MFEVGDFIIYRTPHSTDIGVVLYNNLDGGTLKILNLQGKIQWAVTSGCDVVYAK